MLTDLRKLTTEHSLLLGSGSPRRKEILEKLGLEFTVVKPSITELRLPNEPPYEYAVRLACEKAVSIPTDVNSSQFVLGCDTIVVLGESVLEKPKDEADALRILTSLAGKEHIVCTALSLSKNQKVVSSGYCLTTVYFNSVTEKQLLEYIATGEPMDKAGAYGIQGMGAFLVDRIAGYLDNVIGLPTALLSELASKAILET